MNQKVNENINTDTSANVSLAVRNVALAKRRTKRIIWSLIFISCFSLSFCLGYVGTFLLFKY